MSRRWSSIVGALGLAGCLSNGTVEPPPAQATVPAVEVALRSAVSTGESIPAATVTLRFRNPAATPVVIEAYRIEWPGGRFDAEPDDLRVDAGREVERTARVEARHGDPAALLTRSGEARVEVTRAVVP